MRYFTHAHIRTLINAFGKMFANIYYSSYSVDGKKIGKLTRVPIRYLPISKSHIDKGDPNSEYLNKFIEFFPRIHYDLKGLSYDPENQISKKQRFHNGIQNSYTPSPYSMSFDLGIHARDDIKALEVLEQILPMFRPDIVISIKHPAFDGQEQDITIVLDSVTKEDNFSEEEARFVSYVLSFTVKAHLVGFVENGDLEATKFVKSGGTIIDDAITGRQLELDIDGNLPEEPSANNVIKKVIVDTLDAFVLESEDQFFPVLYRETFDVNSWEDIDGEDLTIVDRKPPQE